MESLIYFLKHESQFYVLAIYSTWLTLSFNQYIEFTINIVTH